MSHHPPPPLHFKSSFTISALYHSLSLPVCLLLVFHTHRHLSSPYLLFHALLTVNLFSCLVPHLAVLHFLFFPAVLSTAPSGHRSSFLWIFDGVCAHTRKKTLSQLSWFTCLWLACVLPFFAAVSVQFHRPLSLFPFRQLMENKITTIERGAFQDLKELERL